MRHRPKRENYPTGLYGDIDYQKRLEGYCTYLENKNKALTEQCNIGVVSISTDLKDKTMERKRILSEINLDTDMFMTSFDKAARLLTEQKERLEQQGWTSVHLKMEYYYEGAELKAYGMRLENDAEFNKRKEAEKKKLKAAERKAERERKKYEKLKLKYGE